MRSLVVIESPELLGSFGIGSSLALSCNIRSFVIELDYGYRYLLEVCSELSDICDEDITPMDTNNTPQVDTLGPITGELVSKYLFL